MKKQIYILVSTIVVILSTLRPAGAMGAEGPNGPYAGSAVCKECHEKFHTLWSTSWHGKASRPYSSEIADKELVPQKEDIVIGQYRYRFKSGKIVETGPEGKKQYPVDLIVGGKVTFNFVTTMPDGWFQELPIGYDREKKEWFDAVSTDAYRKSEDGGHVDWKKRISGLYTACPNCHVSQYSPGYDISTAGYNSKWIEPGVNCETCHGPAGEHIKIARKTPKGQPFAEIGLLRPKTMTAERRNDMCNVCHGHISPLTASFKPGDRFFDHFDLSTLELNAFYPDGRGKGETFTMTSWLINSCAKKAKLDCIHCHTTSGRYRFKDPDKANNACLPCHEARVKNATAHTHHKPDSPGSQCISCHMSPTYHNRMKQSDHSMLPPTPAATLACGSPNACNYCHTDKDASWADKQVRSWHSDDYQATVLRRARLIEEAKKGNWQNLPEMLEYIQSEDRNEVFTATLIRLMSMNRDERILPVLLSALKDPSPLVRGAAVRSIGSRASQGVRSALIEAAGDDYRVVRIGAASRLTAYPYQTGADHVKGIDRAVDELLGSLKLHPDRLSSYEMAGNVYQSLNRLKDAESAYQTALTMDPRAVNVMLTLASMYQRQKDAGKAEELLLAAVRTEPDSGAAYRALGHLKFDKKEQDASEKYFRKAYETDPRSADTAYMLAVIAATDRIDEAIAWCKKAKTLNSLNPLYAHTLALYQDRQGDSESAAKELQEVIARYPSYFDSYFLLGGIYEGKNRRKEAMELYSKAIIQAGGNEYYRQRFKERLFSVEKSVK